MVRWVSVVLVTVVSLMIILVACMFFSGFAGEKIVVDETIKLSPGAQKAYNLPPGYVTVNFTSERPINETDSGFGGHGSGYGLTSDTQEFGALFGLQYTFINPNDADTNVSVQIKTGLLNPFGYL